MRFWVAAATLSLAVSSAAQAAPAHRCSADALKRAKPLLALHFEDDSTAANNQLSIGKEVKTLPPVKALKGKGSFDVLEVWGYIYKAEYRMRFLYARISGDCVLMGQEIIEASDPY